MRKRFNRILIPLLIIVVVVSGVIAYFKLSQSGAVENVGEGYLSPGTPPNMIPNGVYVWDWDKSLFYRVNSSGGRSYYLPESDGYYLYYFHNNLCPHCQYFESKLQPFLRSGGANDLKGKIEIILVACNWFTSDCTDPIARNTFTAFNVLSSPTFLLIRISNGKIANIVDISQEYIKAFPGSSEFEPDKVFLLVRAYVS
ncbi:MAG: hypothetical protein QXJ51_04590 [Sulfolobales archaeon]